MIDKEFCILLTNEAQIWNLLSAIFPGENQTILSFRAGMFISHIVDIVGLMNFRVLGLSILFKKWGLFLSFRSTKTNDDFQSRIVSSNRRRLNLAGDFITERIIDNKDGGTRNIPGGNGFGANWRRIGRKWRAGGRNLIWGPRPRSHPAVNQSPPTNIVIKSPNGWISTRTTQSHHHVRTGVDVVTGSHLIYRPPGRKMRFG